MNAQTLDSFLDELGITARSEARGEKRGKIMGKSDVARNMLANNLAPTSIAKFTGLTVAEINLLK